MPSVKKAIKIAAPKGTIGSDFDLRNYVKYLIDQYHEFKKAEMGKRTMNYAILYGKIKKEFGGKWDMLGVGKFERLTEYLKLRIDTTILGKVQKAKGHRNYSSFEIHKEKQLICKKNDSSIFVSTLLIKLVTVLLYRLPIEVDQKHPVEKRD